MAGGGSGPNAVIPLGLMLFAAAVLGLICHTFKQSLIIACIVTGLIAGAWREEIKHEMPDLLIGQLSQLGIFFVLFSGGMEVDVGGFIKRWKTVLVQSFGMIGINFAVMLGIGIGVFEVEGFAAFVFGLCLTLSSTIVVLGTLANRGEMGEVHGQIILGIMVFQDILAVIGISVLQTQDPGQDAGDMSLGASIGIIFGKLAALLVILAIIRFTVLPTWFRWMSVSGEHVFLGALGYSLGMASLCMLASFSGEMGAFFCGVTVASLPYRLEIEQKVEGIKMLGVTLFFIILGFELEFTGDQLAAALPWAVGLALIVCFITPLFMLPLGLLSKLHAKDSVNIGIVINQISEFSLIIAKMAYDFHVFSSDIFLIIAFGALVSIFVSSIMHLLLDKIVKHSRKLFRCMDRRAHESTEDGGHDFHEHVLLLGYNEIAHQLLVHYCQQQRPVVLLTLDQQIYTALTKLKKGLINSPKAKKNLVVPTGAVELDALEPQEKDGRDSRALLIRTVTEANPEGVQSKVPEGAALKAPQVPGAATSSPLAPVKSSANVEKKKMKTNKKPVKKAATMFETHGSKLPPLKNAPGTQQGNEESADAEQQREAANEVERLRKKLEQAEAKIKELQSAAASAEAAKADPESLPETAPAPGVTDFSLLTVAYADYGDPHVWHHFGIDKAHLVVDCQDDSQVEREVAQHCSQLSLKGHNVPFVAIVHEYEQVNKLYKEGAAYVLQCDHMAGEVVVKTLIKEEAKGEQAFQQLREQHQQFNDRLKRDIGSVLFGV